MRCEPPDAEKYSSTRLVEFERNLVQERTQAGLKAASARGRPQGLDNDKRQLAIKPYFEGRATINKICTILLVLCFYEITQHDDEASLPATSSASLPSAVCDKSCLALSRISAVLICACELEFCKKT